MDVRVSVADWLPLSVTVSVTVVVAVAVGLAVTVTVCAAGVPDPPHPATSAATLATASSHSGRRALGWPDATPIILRQRVGRASDRRDQPRLASIRPSSLRGGLDAARFPTADQATPRPV